MLRKSLIPLLIFSLLVGVFLVSSPPRGHLYNDKSTITRQNSYRVHNLNTSKNYSSIQEAIDAPETLNGHEILAAPGTYHEHITVNKSLSLKSEGRGAAIIDGDGRDKVIYVTANDVEIRNFVLWNGTFGLWLDRSNNSKIIDNTLQHGSYGIRIYHSKNSVLIGNRVSRFTFFGIHLDSSGNSTLRNNIIADNKYNFGVEGNSLFDFTIDIDASNTVNGKPIRYLTNQHDATIDSLTFQGVGYLGLVNSTNIRVQDLDMQDNIQGVLLAFTKNSSISNLNARSNWNGIYVAHSSNISISRNNANNNFDYGIKFFNSPSSLASQNNVENNTWAGIGLFKSPNSTIDRNQVDYSNYNLHIVYTNNSVITRNSAQSKKAGGYSIAVYYSHNNLIYHNTFANSHFYVEMGSETRLIPRNRWDNGLEGNYWSSYRGIDADQDGTGDTPYIVGENNIDNHPLMGKFSDYVVTLGEKEYSIVVISNSTISQFEFNFDYGKLSFRATGDNGTKGFSKIAVPNTFLQGLEHGNLTLLINGKQPALQKNWTDGTYTYWYLSYVNNATESEGNPWLIVVVASALLILIALVSMDLRRRLNKHRLVDELAVIPFDGYDFSCLKMYSFPLPNLA